MKIKANGIDIEVEDTGGEGPVVLLIMGLGMQLIAWPQGLIDTLVQAGFRVIRHDNRDVGLSEHLTHLGKPNLIWQAFKMRMGWTVNAPYSVRDMAQDSWGVLDALGIAQAHVVGVSMGGMIAQRMALLSPQRILSLTSIMSSSGAPGLPPAEPEVLRVLLSRPKGRDVAAQLDHYVKVFKMIGSPGFPSAPEVLRERFSAFLARDADPVGVQRQMVAIAADRTRGAELTQLRCPTLVIHGRSDRLVPYACGEDTARRISGAKMVGIDGMGHDWPDALLPHLLAPLLPHLQGLPQVKPALMSAS